MRHRIRLVTSVRRVNNFNYRGVCGLQDWCKFGLNQMVGRAWPRQRQFPRRVPLFPRRAHTWARKTIHASGLRELEHGRGATVLGTVSTILCLTHDGILVRTHRVYGQRSIMMGRFP